MAAVGTLAGRLALVTGGGSGIGKAVCSVLAREGALLAVADLNRESAQETVAGLPEFQPSSDGLAGRSHAAFGTNVASAVEVSNLLMDVQKLFNSVPSVAVHSAGVNRDAFMLKMDEDTWDFNIDTNLKGTFLVNQAIARAMIQGGLEKGSIVNLSSILGKVGNMGQSAYSASKAGVVAFTKSSAQELARNNIRVNAVLPGFIITPMTGVVPEKFAKVITSQVPLKRMGDPQEIAEVCAFLASERSSYVTGAVIEATGGLYM